MSTATKRVTAFPTDTLPRVDREAQKVLTSLRRHIGIDASAACDRWAQNCLGLSSGEISTRVKRVTCDPTPARHEANTTFALSGPLGQQCTLVLDGAMAHFIQAALLRAIDNRQWTRPSPRVSDMEWGLLAFALGWLLNEVGTTACWTVQSRNTPDSTIQTMAAPVCVEVVAQFLDIRCLCWLVADHTTLRMLEKAPNNDILKRSGRLDGAVCSVAFEIGRFVLPHQTLSTLSLGDAIVFSDCPREVESIEKVWIRAANGVFEATIADGFIELVRPFERRMTQMPPTQTDHEMTTQVQTRPVVDELEIEVVAELGRTTMSTADILQLNIGDTIPLGRAISDPIDLRVGNKLLARAELVQIDDDEAGVRIVELFE